MKIINGYAALNIGKYWRGVIEGNIFCAKRRRLSKTALKDAKEMFEQSLITKQFTNMDNDKIRDDLIKFMLKGILTKYMKWMEDNFIDSDDSSKTNIEAYLESDDVGKLL